MELNAHVVAAATYALARWLVLLQSPVVTQLRVCTRFQQVRLLRAREWAAIPKLPVAPNVYAQHESASTHVYGNERCFVLWRGLASELQNSYHKTFCQRWLSLISNILIAVSTTHSAKTFAYNIATFLHSKLSCFNLYRTTPYDVWTLLTFGNAVKKMSCLSTRI